MTTTTSQTESSRAVMVRMYESAGKGDYQDVLSLLSDDLVVHEPPFLPYGAVYHGLDGMRDLIGKVNQVLDVSKISVDRMVAEGERVIGIIRMPDHKTGESIVLAEESVIRNGKVVEIFVYFHETQTLLTSPRL
jgi:hypothetical protein